MVRAKRESPVNNFAFSDATLLQRRLLQQQKLQAQIVQIFQMLRVEKVALLPDMLFLLQSHLNEAQQLLKEAVSFYFIIYLSSMFRIMLKSLVSVNRILYFSLMKCTKFITINKSLKQFNCIRCLYFHIQRTCKTLFDLRRLI